VVGDLGEGMTIGWGYKEPHHLQIGGERRGRAKLITQDGVERRKGINYPRIVGTCKGRKK